MLFNPFSIQCSPPAKSSFVQCWGIVNDTFTILQLEQSFCPCNTNPARKRRTEATVLNEKYHLTIIVAQKYIFLPASESILSAILYESIPLRVGRFSCPMVRLRFELLRSLPGPEWLSDISSKIIGNSFPVPTVVLSFFDSSKKVCPSAGSQ